MPLFFFFLLYFNSNYMKILVYVPVFIFKCLGIIYSLMISHDIFMMFYSNFSVDILIYIRIHNKWKQKYSIYICIYRIFVYIEYLLPNLYILYILPFENACDFLTSHEKLNISVKKIFERRNLWKSGEIGL